MTREEVFEKLSKAFTRYYDIKTENIIQPFIAEAEFHSHDEHYFISKSAKIFESESNEYVFFASEDNLTSESLQKLDKLAWEEGLSRVDLKEGHKSTDVTLVILADYFTKDIEKEIKKMRHYKSYCFSFKGWSNYRLIALEVTSGKVAHNRQGESLKKLLCDIVR